MTSLTVVGGVYHERAIWPEWNQIYGSAGRAAAAVSGHVDEITLRTYARGDTADAFAQTAQFYGFAFEPTDAAQSLSFDYTHGLAVPTITPAARRLRTNPPIDVAAENVLRFGMLEGTAVVSAERCVYDPQDPVKADPFAANGSRAQHLAIVANTSEIASMTGKNDIEAGVARLFEEGAEVIVVKAGPDGAHVWDASGRVTIPAYQTDRVWSVGSGDVFAAMFAAQWASLGKRPAEAAELASRAVAAYVSSMALPAPLAATLLASDLVPLRRQSGRVYIASPFFSMGERWLVEESLRAFKAMGMEVFSPLHEVGVGPAEVVAHADLEGLDNCDVVFAVVDGLDSGTIFEIGYARAKGKPVYALAVSTPLEDLKMIEGSGCRVYDDFTTAVHHAVWRI